MTKYLFIVLCFFLQLPSINGQGITQKLLQANLMNYNHKIYVYGYDQVKDKLNFKCYSYDFKLNLKDSLSYQLGTYTPVDYLEISTDTTHQVLNFYFQLANQKNRVDILRLTDSLNILCTIKDVEVTKINALTAFDNEKYMFKNSVYVIRSTIDSGTTQFYLSKYELKDLKTLYEYNFKWQFPFEKQFIHRASVMYADSNQVVVYVNVIDGAKKGQWLLRLNANTGELVKGSKLSAKGDNRYFLLSNIYVDARTKQIDAIGSIYEANMIDFNTEKYNFTNQSKSHKLFLVSIDSLGDVISRVENPFPLPIQTKTTDGLKSYHIQVREFKKLKDNQFTVWLDLYEQSKPLVFCYYSSWFVTVTPNDAGYTFSPSKFYISTSAIPNYVSFTKGDLYGKFVLNTIKDYDKFKYQKALSSFITLTDIDELGNSNYILIKRDLMKATKNYNYIFVGKKGLENKIILNTEQGQRATILFIEKNKYISFITNINNDGFELQVKSL